MAAALVSIPLLIRGVGVERFGALTLLWALLGYLSVLDLGLVRSLVQIVAQRLGRPTGADGGENGPLAEIVIPALAVTTLLGMLASVVLVTFAAPLSRLLEADGGLTSEVQTALYVVAVIVPVALVSAGLRGLLEAHHHFRYTNMVRMSVGVLNYLTPLAMLPFSSSLTAILVAIAVGRLTGLVAFVWLCRRLIDLGRPLWHFNMRALRPLFAMGAWMMANNLVGPLMLYADRFALGGMVPAAVIAYYTTPFEVVIRLMFIPNAVSGVLFPLAARLHRSSPRLMSRILDAGAYALLGGFAVILIGVILFGRPLLELWLSGDFARESAPILTILTMGVGLNAVAYIPYAILHGVGRIDITARLQLAELPIYVLVLVFFVHEWGAMGAAIAWSLRNGSDLLLLLLLVGRIVPPLRAQAWRLIVVTATIAVVTATGLAAGGAGGLITVLTVQTIAAGLALAVLAVHWRRGVIERRRLRTDGDSDGDGA